YQPRRVRHTPARTQCPPASRGLGGLPAGEGRGDDYAAYVDLRDGRIPRAHGAPGPVPSTRHCGCQTPASAGQAKGIPAVPRRAAPTATGLPEGAEDPTQGVEGIMIKMIYAL